MWRDLERLCADLAVPYRRPEPFPQNSLLAARVALVGLAERWGDEFCVAVFVRSSAKAGGSTTPRRYWLSWTASAPTRRPRLKPRNRTPNKTRLRSQTEAAQRLGVFGAPSFVTPDSELFWGNDRLEAVLKWATRQVVR